MTVRKGSKKPEKPHPNYPLSAHPSGQWCKRIHGKLYYFGPWDDPAGSLDEYERRLPLITGQRDETEITVEGLCNKFLHSKKGESAERTWNDYRQISKRLIGHFGPSRPIATLKGSDFESLRRSLPASWGAVATNNFIIRTNAILNYAYKEHLVELPIRTGSNFKRVPQKQVRIERAKSPRKFFEANEIRTLIAAATPELSAMILLGVNVGYGNADCARLTHSMLDLDAGWITEPREKTGVWRIGKLWPETINALKRVKPRKQIATGLEDRVFITRNGNAYWSDGGHDAIATAFYRLTTKCKLHRNKVGFYSLRHVTQTVGEQVGDALAVKLIMGHIDSSISERYREDFDRSRIEKVCNHIRLWCFPEIKI